MRYLNQVKPHEKFVASGLYQIIPAATDERREESWSIHELPDGTWFIRADYQEPGKKGLNRLVEVLYEPPNIERTVNSGVTRLNIFEYNAEMRLRQNLVFFEEYVQVGFSLNDEDRVYLEFELPELYVVAGACYVMRGLNIPRITQPVMRNIMGRSELGSIPILLDFDWRDRDIVWWENYQVKPVASEDVTVDNKTTVATHYDWEFGVDDHLHLWLDDHAVTLKLNSAYEATTLHSYSRRPEPKS